MKINELTGNLLKRNKDIVKNYVQNNKNDLNRPEPGEGDVYDWKGEGGKLRIHVTNPNKPDGATLSTGQLANNVYDPSTGTSTGQLAQSGGYAPAGSGRGDGNAEAAARAKRAKELERMQANAGMKDSDYKSDVPGSKAVAKPSTWKNPNDAPKVDPLDAMYPYRAPDGRRLKYPHGDFRNLFHSSPDSKAPGKNSPVVKGDRVGKRLIDQPPVPRRSDDDKK